jgi:hypothetical protein
MRKPIIRKFSAGFLLILFAFCVTPKKVLHDLVAHHRDGALAGSMKSQFLHAGYHCHFDDLVVDSPFVTEISPFEIKIFSVPLPYVVEPIPAVHVNSLFSRVLRGPPVSC